MKILNCESAQEDHPLISVIVFSKVNPTPGVTFALEPVLDFIGHIRVRVVIENPEDPGLKSSRIVFWDDLPHAVVPADTAALELRYLLSLAGELPYTQRLCDAMSHALNYLLPPLTRLSVAYVHQKEELLYFELCISNFATKATIKYKSVERFFHLFCGE